MNEQHLEIQLTEWLCYGRGFTLDWQYSTEHMKKTSKTQLKTVKLSKTRYYPVSYGKNRVKLDKTQRS